MTPVGIFVWLTEAQKQTDTNSKCTVPAGGTESCSRNTFFLKKEGIRFMSKDVSALALNEVRMKKCDWKGKAKVC